MTHWVTTDDVQAFNKHFVHTDLLRDYGLLEAAVLRPQSTDCLRRGRIPDAARKSRRVAAQPRP